MNKGFRFLIRQNGQLIIVQRGAQLKAKILFSAPNKKHPFVGCFFVSCRMSLQNIRIVGGSRERRPQTIALSSPISSAERRFVAKQQYIFSAPQKKRYN
jgi:hypothetical protein